MPRELKITQFKFLYKIIENSIDNASALNIVTLLFQVSSIIEQIPQNIIFNLDSKLFICRLKYFYEGRVNIFSSDLKYILLNFKLRNYF